MRTDPSVLLCEFCGYPIGQLPREGNCPECGRVIVESLPERRVGTPWQRGRGRSSWARTVWIVTLEPRNVWRSVRAEAGSSGLLLTLHCALAAFGVSVLVAARDLTTIEETGLNWRWKQDMVDAASTILIGGFGGLVVLLLLSMIEYAGIRFFGARRRWRVTHGVAMAVVGHASVGWLLLPVTLPLFGWVAAAGLPEALDGAAGIGWLGTIVFVLAALAGPLIPLLAFELLVYEGVRRMRFANSEPPASSRRA